MHKSPAVTNPLLLLMVSCCAALLTACSNISVKESWSEHYAAFKESKVPVCHGYGCNQVTLVQLAGQEWQVIQQLFSQPAKTPQQERQILSQAVAFMEQLAGRSAGTWNDKAKNDASSQPGQQDCIDESTNTTAYLKLFAHQGWLHWHQVQHRVMRSHFLLDVHWTALIKDKRSGQLYAVDSWFRENGREPVVLKLEDWLAKQERL